MRSYSYGYCSKYHNSLDMIRKGLKNDSILLFIICCLGLTPVSAILYPLFWFYGLLKYCQLSSYNYTYPRKLEDKKQLIETCKKAVKYRILAIKIILVILVGFLISATYLTYNQQFTILKRKYLYIISVMSLLQAIMIACMLIPNKQYKMALKDIEKGSFLPYSHLEKKIHQRAVVSQVNL